MQSGQYSDRACVRWTLPMADWDGLAVESVVVYFADARESVDVGALCYVKRASPVRIRRKLLQGRQVQHDTLCPNRITQIGLILQRQSDLIRDRHARPLTVLGHLRTASKFIDWCDENSHGSVLEGTEQARQAAKEYIQMLERLKDQNQLSQNSAAKMQNTLLAFLRGHFGIPEAFDRLERLKGSDRQAEPTEVPGEKEQGELLAWANCIFDGFHDLIVNFRPFPFALDVPKYLGWPGDRLWVFPGTQWARSPESQWKPRANFWDYESGQVFELDAVVHQFESRESARASRRNNQRILTAANTNPLHHMRIWRGMLAVQANALLFAANSGVNLEQLRSLPWDPELETAVRQPSADQRQAFREIKYRAGGRVVSFEIGVSFLPQLRKYLELRATLLRELECPYVFFSFGTTRLTEQRLPVKLGNKFFANFCDALNALVPDLERLTARPWRAAKQDHLMRKHGPEVTAVVMQHSLRTSLKRYSNGSEDRQQREFSEYFEKVESVVAKVRLSKTRVGEQELSIGGCKKPNDPTPVSDLSPGLISPDCKHQEGCPFCKHYRIHADKTDAIKLLSARYCIRLTAQLAESEADFQAAWAPVLSRIDEALSVLRSRIPKIMAQAEREVDDEGALDPYWQRKVAMLVELGVVWHER